MRAEIEAHKMQITQLNCGNFQHFYREMCYLEVILSRMEKLIVSPFMEKNP